MSSAVEIPASPEVKDPTSEVIDQTAEIAMESRADVELVSEVTLNSASTADRSEQTDNTSNITAEEYVQTIDRLEKVITGLQLKVGIFIPCLVEYNVLTQHRVLVVIFHIFSKSSIKILQEIFLCKQVQLVIDLTVLV